MEIGLSTASYFRKLQTEDAILEIGAQGIPLCELFLNTFTEYEPMFIDLLAERLQRANVSAYSVHPMSMQFEPQLFSIHPRQRDDAWRIFEQVLSGARRVGASHYVMHGPARLFGGVKNIALTRIAPIYLELSALAAEYGVQLTLENVSWCLFNEPEFGLRFLDATKDDSVCFTLDVKQAVRSGYDPLDYIKTVGRYIENVHLCDATNQSDGNARYSMPGFGAYDFSGMFDALADAGYRGPAFIEVYSDMYQELPELYESYARMQSARSRSRLG